LLSSAVVRYQQRFRRTEFCWAFSFYLLLLNLYWPAVPGRTSNEFPNCSNTGSLCVMLQKFALMKFTAQENNLKFVIEEDLPEVGFYLYVFDENKKCFNN
jgi:hypothetical protein